MPLFRWAILFGLTANLLVLTPTFYMLEVYDRVLSSRSETTLAMLLILVLFGYVLMELLELVRAELMGQAAQEIDTDLRSRLFDAAFAAQLRWPGAAGNTQTFADLRTLSEFLSSPALMAAMDAPVSLLFLGIVAAMNPWLGLLALVGALLQVLVAVRTERRTMPELTEANHAAIAAQGYAKSTLRAAPLVEAMCMSDGIRSRWLAMHRRFLRLQADASDHSGLNTAVSRLVQTLVGSLILGVACWLSLAGSALSGGMMIVASALGGRVLSPLVLLVAHWRSVINVRDAYGRLDRALTLVLPDMPGMPLGAPSGHLAVEAVTAAAPGSQVAILRNVTFTACPGEVLLVVGPSAAGKSSLARLLTGVWQANIGKVRLDGADVHSWSKVELGKHLGYLPQGVELFDGTVAENVARFGPIDPVALKEAITLVGLDKLAAKLPEGIHTRIGDEGEFLSGGQRQLVGLARAIYGMPRLIVLDEPNANLDGSGDAALAETLCRLKAAAATVIVMSHRTSILPAVDRMLVLREGAVAALGTRDEVLAALRNAAQQPSATSASTPPPLNAAR